MRKALVRVEAKRLPFNADERDRRKQLEKLMREFKRECQAYKIQQSYKEHEFFTRESDYRRRKEMMKKQLQRQNEGFHVERPVEERDNKEW